jgi:hypothetical protein
MFTFCSRTRSLMDERSSCRRNACRGSSPTLGDIFARMKESFGIARTARLMTNGGIVSDGIRISTKQHLPKLLVPRIVVDLICAFDSTGKYCLDNVDVGGVITSDGADGRFILAILNSCLAGWIFRRLSKPFQGNLRSANRQFIAPLPVPPASPAQVALVVELASSMENMTTQRRLRIADIRARLRASGVRSRPESWLWPEIGTLDEWEARAPDHLDTHERAAWAGRQRSKEIEARLDAIQVRLQSRATLEAGRRGTQMLFAIDGVPVLERVFVEQAETDFVLAQWRLVARTFTIAPQTKAKALVDALRRLAIPRDPALVRQILSLDGELERLDAEIRETEARIEAVLAELYGLTNEDRQMIARS